MVKIIWTKRGFGQLERVIRFTKEEQGLSYAEAVLNRILKSSELLKSMPKIVRVEPLLEHKKSELDLRASRQAPFNNYTDIN